MQPSNLLGQWSVTVCRLVVVCCLNLDWLGFRSMPEQFWRPAPETENWWSRRSTSSRCSSSRNSQPPRVGIRCVIVRTPRGVLHEALGTHPNWCVMSEYSKESSSLAAKLLAIVDVVTKKWRSCVQQNRTTLLVVSAWYASLLFTYESWVCTCQHTTMLNRTSQLACEQRTLLSWLACRAVRSQCCTCMCTNSSRAC
jgi:hypothetical protein